MAQKAYEHDSYICVCHFCNSRLPAWVRNLEFVYYNLRYGSLEDNYDRKLAKNRKKNRLILYTSDQVYFKKVKLSC